MNKIILLACGLLSSCGVLAPLVPELKKDSTDISLPDSWTSRINSGVDAHSWVKRFNDSELSKLVDEALRNNHTLLISAERIQQLQASQLITGARHKPDLSGSFGVSNSGSLNNYDVSESTPYSLSFSSGWETDLWGRLKNIREQSHLDTESAKADYYATRLSIAGNTASAYFNLLSAQNSKTLAEETLSNFLKSMRIIERNYKAGVPGVEALDVQFGRNNVTAAQRGLSETKLNLTRTSQALQILLGRYPEGTMRASRSLPPPLASLPNTLPKGVIEQRPDLISARKDLLGLTKEIDIRQKALLPSISISGRVSGDSSVNLARLLDPAYLGWTVASSLTQRIYDGGERKAAISQVQAQHRGAIHRYSQDVLNALREVEFSIQADKSIEEQTRLLKEEVRVTTLAEKQAQRDYSEGLENVRILSVLEAQRRAVNARSSLIRIRNERLQNQIDLFVAMGGNP